MISISLIEDNEELANGLKMNLQIEGYQVNLCHDGALALKHIKQHQPDLLILDMMLPYVDGFEIINQLRKERIRIPTLCLTARSTEMDKVRALRSGADDYLTKPFGLMELLARVEALLRRNQVSFETNITPSRTTIGHIRIDQAAKNVRIDAKLINLSPKEFQLLTYLAAHKGCAISRLELMQQVWGHQAAINSRTVDTHIAELRKKCQLDGNHDTKIITVSKFGYQLQFDDV